MLAVLVLSLLVVIMDNTILNVALSTIQNQLSATQSEMQWAVDSYALVFAGLMITCGVLGDRIGRRRMLVVGMTLFGAGSGACAFASTPTQLIVCRALLGIGAAAVQPQTLSIIQHVFPPAERAKAIGIWAGASGMAIALGPITGGVLIKYFWWGSLFLINVPVVVVGIAAMLWVVPESRGEQPGRFDLVGAALSTVAMTVLVYGIVAGGNTNAWLRFDTGGLILGGLALTAVFVGYERRHPQPMIDVLLFTDRRFTAGVAVIALIFFALMGATFYLSYFLQAVRGYTPLATGVALIAVAAGVMIMSTRSPALVRRWGAHRVAATGLTIFTTAMASFGFATASMPQWLLELQMLAIGAGLGLTMTPATDAAMAAVPVDQTGAGSAVNNTLRQLAGALGVAVLGSIVTVCFHAHLGADRASRVADALDQPRAVVQQLPQNTQVRPLVGPAATESIGGAIAFASDARDALQRRVALPQSRTLPAATLAEQQQDARTHLLGFIRDADNAFVRGLRICSGVAALSGLFGAVVAARLLPRRRRQSRDPATPVPALA